MLLNSKLHLWKMLAQNHAGINFEVEIKHFFAAGVWRGQHAD